MLWSRDIYIAFMVLIVSVFVTLLTYAKIQKLESLKRISISDISDGATKLFLMQHGRCVGTLSTTLTRPSISTLQVNATLRVTVPRGTVTVSLGGLAVFNPLGQLIDSNFNLSSPSLDVSLLTRGAHPIETTLRIRAESKESRYQFELPGPIIMREEYGTYKVESSGEGHVSPLFEHLLTTFGDRTAITAVPSCPNDDSGSVNLAPALAELGSVLPVQALEYIMRLQHD